METERRIGLGSVVVGLVATLGVTVILLALGVALLLATTGIEAPEARGAVLAWAAAAGGIGAFVGGRFAAMGSNALTSREGTLAGFVTWAAWVGVVGVAAIAVATWAWSIGAFDPILAARRPETALALWGALVVHAVMLGAAVWGGVRGARAEALAITPPEATWEIVEDPTSFERRFLADS
jgi:hypothetical protein